MKAGSGMTVETEDGAAEPRDASDRRAAEPRRAFTWRTVFYGFTRSRRRALRRGEDADVIFLDWHHPWLFFLAVGIMLLSNINPGMVADEASLITSSPSAATLMSKSGESIVFRTLMFSGLASAINITCFDCGRSIM